MTSIIPRSRLTELGTDVESLLHPKIGNNMRTVTLTIDKTMLEDVNFARLYNYVVQRLIKDDINGRDTARGTKAS